MAISDGPGSGIAIVGAYLDDDNGNLSGAAYLFDAGCRADLNEDGAVDAADLLALLSAWGTDGAGSDLALPLDVVNVSDLLDLLAAWGPCE